MERFSGSFLETDFLKPLSGKNKAPEFLNWCFLFCLHSVHGHSIGQNADISRTFHRFYTDCPSKLRFIFYVNSNLHCLIEPLYIPLIVSLISILAYRP